MATKGTIVFRGDSGSPENNYSKTQVTGVTDAAALTGLATAIGAHSNCNVAKESFASLTLGTDSAPGTGACVDKKGIAYFRHPTTLRTHSLTIPAIKNGSWENTPEGDRLTAGSLTAIVAAVNTATGVSYTPLWGKVIQKA